MSQKYLFELEEELNFVEKDLTLMKNILRTAKEQLENAETYYATYDLYESIEESVKGVTKRRNNLMQKIKQYKSTAPNKHIKFMFFKAGHKRFQPDEIKFMARSLRKFGDEDFFELENVDFGMSDYATLYATEKLSDKDAQYMWDFYWENQFDENDDERYENGDLMHWNGKELTDENGSPLIK